MRLEKREEGSEDYEVFSMAMLKIGRPQNAIETNKVREQPHEICAVQRAWLEGIGLKSRRPVRRP